MVNGDDGEIVVPVGTPVRLTVIEPENPYLLVTDTWIIKAPPGDTVAEVGVADKVKSAGGGPVPPPSDELPPPQETNDSNKPTEAAQSNLLAGSLPVQ